ncbi:hypothetical protein ACSIDX_001326 [Campylobacter lari]
MESLIYSEVARLEGIINTKIAEVKTEFSEQISSAKQKALYWLLGTAVATTVTILSSIWIMMNFMLENLK